MTNFSVENIVIRKTEDLYSNKEVERIAAYGIKTYKIGIRSRNA